MSKRLANLADLTPDTHNANRGTARGRGLLERSLRQYGAGRSILADQHGNIIAGNKTLEAAADIGLPIRVIETDGSELVVVQRRDLDLLTDKAARELAYADNRIAQLDLDWDTEALLADQADGLDLAGVGFSDDELAALLAGIDLGTEGLTDPDAVPAPPAVPITQPGDLWRLGRHRLLCGDSTVATDIERLMAGARAQIVYTDPPYGVAYDGGTKVREYLSGDESGTTVYAEFLPLLSIAAEEKAPLYLWYADRVGIDVLQALKDARYECRIVIVWNKNQAQFGALSAQYKQKHEPCWYGHRRGVAPYWYGPTNETTVWDVDRAQSNDYHPTQKPVALAARALNNSSKPGDIVLDLFLGGGSTLIAAEQLGRTCYGLEISPAYCDVIVARWEAFTGRTATREVSA